MATTLIKEPYVEVRENIRDYPAQLNTDGTSNIGGVIVAPTGPRISFVKDAKDFLDKYTVDGSIPRNADITLLNAYYLSLTTSLVLVRSMNTQATNGLLFDLTPTQCCSVNSPDPSFGFKVSKGNKSVNVGYKRNDSTFGIKGTSFEDIAIELTKFFGIKFIGSTDKSKFFIQGKVSDLNDINFEEIPGFDVEFAFDVDEDDQRIATKTFEGISWNFRDSLPVKYTQTIEIDITNSPYFGFNIGEMAFYYGMIDKTLFDDYSLIQLQGIKGTNGTYPDLDAIVTSLNNIQGLVVSGEYDSTTRSKYTITVESVTDYSLSTEVTVGGEIGTMITCGELVELGNMPNYEFGIIYNTPSNSNDLSVIIDGMDNDLFKLTTMHKGEVNEFTASLNPDATDNSGNNCYIGNLDTSLLPYTILVNETSDITEFTVPSISLAFSCGDSGLDISASKSVSCMIDAINALGEQDTYRVEYLSEFGYTNSQFLQNYTSVGLKRNWFTPVSIPYDRLNVSSIKQFADGIEESSNVLILGPFDRNTSLTGWRVNLAPTSLYYRRLILNKLSNKEFSAIFDITNGILDYSNPVIKLDKPNRTTLLNLKCPVNFAVYDQSRNLYYLNDNRTHQSKNNLVTNEENRRLINKIKKDAVEIMKVFKGRKNTSSTRLDVETVFTNYMNTNFMTQVDKPEEFRVICNETNNTAEIINADKLAIKLQIRLQGSIKFIDVLVDAYPLGIDFEE